MTQNAINSTSALLQSLTTATSSAQTLSVSIPGDNTIPQNTEGTEVLTLAITPFYSTSTLEIIFTGVVTRDTNGATFLTIALFQDSTADALAANACYLSTNESNTAELRYKMTAGNTNSTTFKIRIGPNANSAYLNADNAGNRLMGGVSATRLTINEYL